MVCQTRDANIVMISLTACVGVGSRTTLLMTTAATLQLGSCRCVRLFFVTGDEEGLFFPADELQHAVAVCGFPALEKYPHTAL